MQKTLNTITDLDNFIKYIKDYNPLSSCFVCQLYDTSCFRQTVRFAFSSCVFFSSLNHELIFFRTPK